jgi:hypothetical protein
MAHVGNTDNFTWVCPFTKTGKKSAHSTCAKEFAKQNEFQLIETSDDGNCFFYTLSKFGRRSGYEPLELHVNEHRNSMMLRNILVDHINDHFDKYEAFLFNNNNNQGGSKENQITELRENGVWDASAGDLVPYAGANAFSININMYNIINHGENDVVHLIQIHPDRPSPIYVNIMRVREGHFQLLWPKSGIFSSNVRNLENIEEKEEKGNSLHREASSVTIAIEAAKVAVKAAHQAVNSSLNKKNINENKLERITNELNKLSIQVSKSPSRATRRSSRISTKTASPIHSTRSSTLKSKIKKIVKHNNNNNNINNNNLKAILEASKYNY